MNPFCADSAVSLLDARRRSSIKLTSHLDLDCGEAAQLPVELVSRLSALFARCYSLWTKVTLAGAGHSIRLFLCGEKDLELQNYLRLDARLSFVMGEVI